MQDLGANEAKLLDLNTHTDVISPHAVALVERATGVFFTGGDQVRIAQILGGTPLDRLLIRRHRAGLTVAGTSAGAAIMSSIMIVGGAGIGSLRTNNVELGTGMEFLPGAIIDQHFQQRWRFRRLLAAVAQYPHELGIGIDENTAIIVRDNQFTVLGEGSVTVMDGKRITHVTRPAPGNNTLLALCGVTIHVLTERMRYDLKNRVPLIEKEKEYASGRAAR
jgi:cyanophycinase